MKTVISSSSSSSSAFWSECVDVDPIYKETICDKWSPYIGKVFSGKEFNQLTKSYTFLKFINYKRQHQGMHYEVGLNVDVLKFSPVGSCSSGGLYFSDERHISMWTDYFGKLLCVIKIPDNDDAKVYVEHNKYKCNMFEIVEIGSTGFGLNPDGTNIKNLPPKLKYKLNSECIHYFCNKYYDMLEYFSCINENMYMDYLRHWNRCAYGNRNKLIDVEPKIKQE